MIPIQKQVKEKFDIRTLPKPLSAFHLFAFLMIVSISAKASDPASEPQMIVDHVIGVNAFPVLSLKSGRTFVLSGIERPSTDPNPKLNLSPSLNWMADQILDRRVIIQPSGHNYDFLGRIHGLVKIKGQDWINLQLLRSGRARAQATAGFIAHFNQMLEAEIDARKNQRGNWADRTFRIYDTHQYDGPNRGFIIAEGKVLKISKRKNYIYINFGTDWRQDFTIGIWRSKNHFDSKTLKFTGWEGKKVQIRGHVEQWNGPFIKLTQPHHLILLDAD